jgi:hypothetical protein
LACRSRAEATIRFSKHKKEQALKRRRGVKPITTNATVSNHGDNNIDFMSDVDVVGAAPSIEQNILMVKGYKKVRLNTIDETVTMMMKRLREATSQQNNLHDSETYTKDLVENVRDIRRILNKEKEPPIDKFIVHGLLHTLSLLIRNHSDPNILYESIWCLITVSSSNVSSHVQAVISSSIVPDVVGLMVHANPGVAEQAVWFVANVIGENSQCRDAIIQIPEVTDALLHHVKHPYNISLLSTSAWAVSNVYQGQLNLVAQNILAPRFIPELVTKLTIGANGRVKASELVDLTNALYRIADTSTHCRSLVFGCGTIPVLIKTLQNYSSLPDAAILLHPTIQTLCLFASGTPEQTEDVVKSGFLNYAFALLQSSKNVIQLDTLLTLSNIAAGTIDHINKIIQHQDLIKETIYLATVGSDAVKKEALWALSNITTNGVLKHAHNLVRCGSIPAFCKYLELPYDNNIVMIILEAIEKLLTYNQEADMGYIKYFELCNGIKVIEDLQDSQNDTIYETVYRIIVNFFNGREEDENDENNQNIAPAVAEGDASFLFGTDSLPAKQLFPENVEMQTSGRSYGTTPFYDFSGNN